MSTQHVRDATSASLISVLDAAESVPGAIALRDRSYRLLGLPRGARAVDVGCGTGRAVAELADRGMRAVGVDISEEMLAVARRRLPAGDFRVAGADDLPFDDESMAGYRADKVYHELGEPARAAAEARRVLAPGGRIVLAGQDWDTFVIDSDAGALTRAIVHARADTIPSPRAARAHRNLLLDAGFEDVTVEVHTGVFTDETMLPVLSGLADAARAAGAITRKRAEDWTAEQAERARDGRFFLAIPMFVAAAVRP